MNSHPFPTASDIEKVHKKYPQLRFVAKNDSWIFVGSVDIVGKEGVYYDDYDIIIESTPFFSKGFPKLFETSGKFPKTGEWHVFMDGSCCTAVKQKEILATRNGITIFRYLDEFALPYLANQTHRKETGNYANGEYRHNTEGELQYFVELFRTEHPMILKDCLQLAMNYRDYSKNQVCFCGSGEKYKSCHLKSIEKAKLLGYNYLIIFFDLIDFIIRNAK